MAALKNIKLKIQSVQKTRKVTRAMEAVSAVKMRKAQERAIVARPYAAAAFSVLERISGTADVAQHPLTQAREGKTAVILVVSDKGLAGALNSAAIKRTESALKARGLTRDNTVFICIGRRGADYFANRGYDVQGRHENVGDAVSESEMQFITDTLLMWHREGAIGSALIIYTNFLSTFEQKPVARQVLPITPLVVGEMVRGIAPVKGKFSADDFAGSKIPVGYQIEPSSEAVLETVLPRIINVVVYHALLEAKASEHSARRVAMKNATDKAGEIARELTLVFNKARQAAITAEVSEITSGIEAMK
jgi:F-type H+-transporting ATPase subunit gamma